MGDASQWWKYCRGAYWRQPLGEGSSIIGMGDHPVVHIAYRDAQEYAQWAGKSLPTEAQWEYAARGGLEQAWFAWGEELAPGGVVPANIWEGEFPVRREPTHDWDRTTPVCTFAPNGFGLYDMIGNVWEWTDDWCGAVFPGKPASGHCCIPRNRFCAKSISC